MLTTAEITPKQTVRNIESALIAHLGNAGRSSEDLRGETSLHPRRPKEGKGEAAPAAAAASVASAAAEAAQAPAPAARRETSVRRPFYFEDVEVRRSRATGITCRVTLSKGEKSFIGEAEGMENERSRIELAARAALRAIAEGEPGVGRWTLAGRS